MASSKEPTPSEYLVGGVVVFGGLGLLVLLAWLFIPISLQRTQDGFNARNMERFVGDAEAELIEISPNRPGGVACDRLVVRLVNPPRDIEEVVPNTSRRTWQPGPSPLFQALFDGCRETLAQNAPRGAAVLAAVSDGAPGQTFAWTQSRRVSSGVTGDGRLPWVQDSGAFGAYLRETGEVVRVFTRLGTREVPVDQDFDPIDLLADPAE